jgi:hypothetical protein
MARVHGGHHDNPLRGVGKPLVFRVACTSGRT